MNEQEIIANAVETALQRGREIFREKDDCDSKMSNHDRELGTLERDVAVIANDVKDSKKFRWTVVALGISLLGTAIWGLIAK